MIQEQLLKQLVAKQAHVRLSPAAIRLDRRSGAQLGEVEWIMRSLDRNEGVFMMTASCLYAFLLPYDDIREFMENASWPSDVEGTLLLNKQVCFKGDNIEIRSLLVTADARESE